MERQIWLQLPNSEVETASPKASACLLQSWVTKRCVMERSTGPSFSSLNR